MKSTFIKHANYAQLTTLEKRVRVHICVRNYMSKFHPCPHISDH